MALVCYLGPRDVVRQHTRLVPLVGGTTPGLAPTSIRAQTVSNSRNKGGLAIAQASNKHKKISELGCPPAASISATSARALVTSWRRQCARTRPENTMPTASSVV